MKKLALHSIVGIVVLGSFLVGSAGPSQAAALREQQIIDLVTNEAVQRLQIPRRNVEVVWQDQDASTLVPDLPDGQVTVTMSPNAHLGGRSSIPIEVFVDGRKYRTIFPRLDVQLFEDVLVARDRISRGSLMAREDFKLEHRSIVNQFQSPLTRPDSVLGAEATRDILPDTVLTAPMFKLPTIVKSGDMVSVVLTDGDLTVVSSGQARSDGAMGQLIKVQNTDTKREFTARVTGPNRVEVYLED